MFYGFALSFCTRRPIFLFFPSDKKLKLLSSNYMIIQTHKNQYRMIVYKSAGQCIVELELLPDSLTNLKRGNVIDSNHAKFRCNKALVMGIYDKFTEEKVEVVGSDYDRSFKYEVKRIMEEPEYDNNVDIVCSKGIHFYLTKETAFFHGFDTSKYSGRYKSWHENGNLSEVCTYLDGKEE